MYLLLAASNPETLELLLENVLAITIFFIFIAALLGAYLRSKSRDNCLKDFHGYQVSVQPKNGEIFEGRLLVFSTGFEVVYPAQYDNPEGNTESSSLLYKNEYENIHSLLRHHDQLTPGNKKKRLRQVRQTYQPSLARWMWRRLRNAFNIFRDAIAQSLEAVFGSAKKSSALMSSQGGQISGMGRGLIGHFGNAYDPILERLVGKWVLVEVNSEGGTIEYPGILKEYTKDFLEVLCVPLERECDLILPRTTSVVRHAGKRESVDWKTFLLGGKES